MPDLTFFGVVFRDQPVKRNVDVFGVAGVEGAIIGGFQYGFDYEVLGGYGSGVEFVAFEDVQSFEHLEC